VTCTEPQQCSGASTVPAWCTHQAGCHDGTRSSAGSAPPAARAWLLMEQYGPWPAWPLEAALNAPARKAADLAATLGIRVQLIRPPGRRPPVPRGRAGTARAAAEAIRPVRAFLGWSAGRRPWLRSGELTGTTCLPDSDLHKLSEGRLPSFGSPAAGPLILVCAHGRRNVCCARFGGPLARALAGRYPGVWETTHVGGDEYAANLVILPHGLYYGPVGVDAATAAISAYSRNEVLLSRYRGRAGQPSAVQAAEHSAMSRTGFRGIPGTV
jgi:hypothetical protein